MTDELTTVVRDGLAPVHMPDGLDGITARGRRLRRRRRAGAAGLGAVVTALAVTGGLTLTTPSGDPGPAEPKLAAWSVENGPGGAVTVTVRDLRDADQLTARLREAGVPSLVEFKELTPKTDFACTDDGRTSLPISEVLQIGGDRQVYTIQPDRMPPGTSLHIVVWGSADGSGLVATSRTTRLVEGKPVPCQSVEPE